MLNATATESTLPSNNICTIIIGLITCMSRSRVVRRRGVLLDTLITGNMPQTSLANSNMSQISPPEKIPLDPRTCLCHKQRTLHGQILHYNTISIILHLKKILCIKEEENLEYLSVIFCQNIRRCISAR